MRFYLSLLFFCFVFQAYSQDTIMSIEEYSPISSLKVPENKVYRAKYPFVDVHNHQWNMPEKDLNALVDEMDDLNMAFMINLSGSGWGAQAEKDAYFEASIKKINDNLLTIQ